jgi:hypothetical protein
MQAVQTWSRARAPAWNKEPSWEWLGNFAVRLARQLAGPIACIHLWKFPSLALPSPSAFAASFSIEAHSVGGLKERIKKHRDYRTN